MFTKYTLLLHVSVGLLFWSHIHVGGHSSPKNIFNVYEFIQIKKHENWVHLYLIFFQTFHYEDAVVKLPHSYKTSPPHSQLPEPLSLTQFDEMLQTFLHSKLGQTDVSMLTQKIYRYADFNNNGQVGDCLLYLIFLYLTDNGWIYWFKGWGLNPGQLYLLQPNLIVS